MNTLPPHEQKSKTTPETSLIAYIAALVDSEACIRIDNSDGKYRLSMQIELAYLPTLEMLVSRLGGTVRLKRKRIEGYKQTYVWSVSGTKNVYECLVLLHPYLREKRLQSELAILYREEFGEVNPRRRGRTIEQKERQKWYCQRMKELKRTVETSESRDIVEVAYVAGLIDGEGCIKINKQLGRYALQVAVHITYYPSLEMLKQMFGGNIYRYASQQLGRNKEICAWMLGGANSVHKFLLALLPYLREKKSQAELALAYYEEGLWIHNHGTGHGKTSEQKERQEWYYQHMKELKEEQ